MLDLKSFSQAIQQIADEKGIAKEKIIETIELALAAAYKRDYGKKGQIVHAKLDPVTGRASMKQVEIVVDETMIKSEADCLLHQGYGRQKERRLVLRSFGGGGKESPLQPGKTYPPRGGGENKAGREARRRTGI